MNAAVYIRHIVRAQNLAAKLAFPSYGQNYISCAFIAEQGISPLRIYPSAANTQSRNKQIRQRENFHAYSAYYARNVIHFFTSPIASLLPSNMSTAFFRPELFPLNYIIFLFCLPAISFPQRFRLVNPVNPIKNIKLSGQKLELRKSPQSSPEIPSRSAHLPVFLPHFSLKNPQFFAQKLNIFGFCRCWGRYVLPTFFFLKALRLTLARPFLCLIRKGEPEKDKKIFIPCFPFGNPLPKRICWRLAASCPTPEN